MEKHYSLWLQKMMPISILLELKILKRQYYMVFQIRTYDNFYEYFIISQSVMSIAKKDKNPLDGRSEIIHKLLKAAFSE